MLDSKTFWHVPTTQPPDQKKKKIQIPKQKIATITA